MLIREILSEQRSSYKNKRIDELFTIPDYSSERDWSLFKPHWNTGVFDDVSNFKGMIFRVKQDSGMVRIVGYVGEQIQAYLTLMHQTHGYTVQAVQVASTWRGQGIAVHMYEIALKQMDLTLISDYEQTSGGSAIWTRLQKDPEILIDGIDVRDGSPVQLADIYDSPDYRLRAKAKT